MSASLGILHSVRDVIADYVRIKGLRNSAPALAADLDQAGLLAGSTTRLNPREAAAAVLQCRMSWPDAEAVAKLLAELGLLGAGDPK